MMNPEMMKLAMEQMSRMTPEQRAAMMSSMPANVSPDMMATAMEQMKHMKPEDWERARNEMSRMDPDTLARQAAAAQSQMAGRQQYVMNASNQLKTEGNQLHAQGRYEEAVAKYERARSNVEAFTGKEAADLARACTLNLSSCYLNLKQYDKCIEQCNTVLAADEHNLKALYRRGQARAGWAQWLDAAADLERALKLAKDIDQGQVGPIRDKLQEVKDRISALRASGQLPPASAAAPAPAPAPAAPAPAASTTTTPSSAPAAAAAGPSGRGPSQQDMARAAELIQKNPEMLKQAQSMFRGMSDEQLRAMARAAGVDDASVDLEALRRGDVRLGPEGLDPALMAKVQQMQAELPPELRTPEAARDPESMKKMAELLSKKPELASTMQEVLTSMDPEQLAEMAKAAGMPAGMTLTPEMARMAADMMKNMSPEQVAQAMQQNAPLAAARAAAAAAAQAPAPATAGAGAGAGASSSSALADRGDTAGNSTSGRGVPAGGVVPAIDPKQAAEMMAAMSPEQLEMMAKAMPGGDKMGMTPEMLKMAADMMKNMSPEELAKMQEMAASMGMAGPGGVAAGATAGVPAVPPGGLTPEMAQVASEMMKNMTPEDLAKMQEMAAKMGMGPGAGAGGMPPGGMTPEMAQMATEMMKNMKPEDMVAMQEMAAKMGMGPGAGAGAAGMPPGGMTPEMAKMAADMMKNMKPEDIAAMQEMASKMGGMPGMGPGAGRPGPGGLPAMGDMGSMLKDPAMIENMIKMMKSMDPDAMANMLMSSGMVKDRAQAEAMARQMGSLTDAQLKMMVGATAKLQAVREWFMRNKLLVAALIILAIALLLRWLGWM